MPTAEIGRWEFYIPEEWKLKDVGIDVSYMEAPDGTKGMYAKTVHSNPPEASALAFADYIQRTHRGGFEADPEANWSVVGTTGQQEGDLHRSQLDLWDQDSEYRVLSIVLCSASYALQLTLHDYACPDALAPNPEFDDVESSIRLSAGAA